MYMCVYIYTYRERERDTHTHRKYNNAIVLYKGERQLELLEADRRGRVIYCDIIYCNISAYTNI